MSRRHAGLFASLLLGVGVLAIVPAGVSADMTPGTLPFNQDWSNPGLITTADNWGGVPSIIGYRGDGLVASTNVDPRTVLADGAGTPVNVLAQSTAANGTGGIHEIEASQVVALQGSGTADAPHLVIRLNTTGQTALNVAYTLVDLDADNAGAQQVALQYRVGGSGNYVDVPAGYVADASNNQGDTFPVAVTLPAAVDNQAIVDIRILTTDAGGVDSMTGVDDIAITAGGGQALPVAVCPSTLATPAGTAASGVVSATDADSAIASITITSPPVDGITVRPTGAGTATLDVAATTAAGTYGVVIEFATDDVPLQTTTCTVEVSVLDVTLISTVQGASAASDFVGDRVLVEGIVTSLFTDNDALDGFFVQEEDDDSDDNAETSEAVFVDCTGTCPTGLAKGDVVQVIGTVAESFGRTGLQADGGDGTVTVLNSGNTAPAAVAVELPAPSRTNLAGTFEAFEGMRATFPDTLAVSEYFQLARFGQLVLTVDERPFQFTHLNPPSAAGNNAHVADLATRRIFLDDDNDDENDATVDGPDEPYPYPTGGLALDNRFRGGDTITGLTGVLDWSFGAWRIRPIPGDDYSFTPANPAPGSPDDVGGDVKVSAFNVLNSFDTIDTTSSNSVGPCAPSGTLDCRGADSESELVRQRTKIVAALAEIDADVFGFMEIQNDEGQTTNSIVAALNAVPGAGPYAAIDTGFIGTDAIKVALIYKPASVEPVGDFVILDSTVDPDFIDTRNRPALIQTFEQVGTDERFTVAVNHLKSKGSSCDIDTDDPNLPDDPDLLDGQGNCPGTRTEAAQALADYLATDPTASGDPDFLIIGDLNSYRRETPITTLVGAGYNDLIEQFVGDDAYSFVFDGQLGYLDHALATDSLKKQVTGATEWKINSDEVPLFDYNDEFADPGEASFERESAALSLYTPTPARSSDHDPLVVGLDLPANRLEIDDALITVGRRGGGTLLFTGDTDARLTACPTLDLRVEGAQVLQGAVTTRVGRTSVCVTLTSRGLLTYDFATGGFAGLLDLPSSFTLTDNVVRFEVGVNGDPYVTDRSGRRLGPIWIAD